MAQSFVLWHRASFWHRNTLNLCNRRVPKLKNSACAEFLDSLLWFCGTELCFVTQSFAFAVFATLICQINSVFPCKDTKAAKSCAFCVIRLVPNSWIICFGLWHRAGVLHPNHGTELCFVAQSWGLWHRALLSPSLQL